MCKLVKTIVTTLEEAFVTLENEYDEFTRDIKSKINSKKGGA